MIEEKVFFFVKKHKKIIFFLKNVLTEHKNDDKLRPIQ